MPSFESIAVRQDHLIRKALGGLIAVAPTTVALPTALTTGASADLSALPAGYEQLGLVTKDDGVSFSRETDTSDVTSWGRVEPTRRDIVSDVRSAAFTCQETNRQVLEMYENVDLSAVEADATTGETTFNSTSSPQTTYRRMLFLSYDGAGADRIYIAKIMPRASVSEAGEQTLSDQGELNYPMTVTAFVDATAGYAVRHVFGGPGWKTILEDAGFTLAA